MKVMNTQSIFSPSRKEVSVGKTVVILRSPQDRFRFLQQMVRDQNLVSIATDHFVSIG